MSRNIEKDLIDDLIEDENSNDDLIEEVKDDDSSVNIPLNGSPLYPRIFIGDSAKPTMSQFNDSEWVDSNIHNTWKGLMSFYG